MNDTIDPSVQPLNIQENVWKQEPFWTIERARIGKTRTVPVELIINGEVVERQRHSVGKAIGLIVGVGEVVGGVIAPFLDGLVADKFGLTMPFWVSMVAAILAFLRSFSLIEPAKE